MVEVSDFMRTQVSTDEAELEAFRTKKHKGPPKKQKEKLVVLQTTLTNTRKLKDRIEEVIAALEFIEPSQMKNLKVQL